MIRPATHLCCPHCRLRFAPATAAYITSCPECGDTPQPIARLELTFGYRVIAPEDLPHDFPYATAVSIALPAPEAPTKPAME